MAMLCHMPNLADLIAPERDSVSDSCHEAAPREPWGYEGYMSGGAYCQRHHRARLRQCPICICKFTKVVEVFLP